MGIFFLPSRFWLRPMGAGRHREVVAHDPEPRLFRRTDVPLPLGGEDVGVVHHAGLLRQDAGLEEDLLAVARLQHVQADADMGVEEALLVERGFARALDADEEDRFHTVPLRHVAPPVDVVHRQRRDQGGQGDDAPAVSRSGRVDLPQRVGPLGQVAQQEPGALGEVAGPAVDVGREVALQPADQLRGGPARRVRRGVLRLAQVLEDRPQRAVEARRQLAGLAADQSR